MDDQPFFSFLLSFFPPYSISLCPLGVRGCRKDWSGLSVKLLVLTPDAMEKKLGRDASENKGLFPLLLD